MMTKEDPASSSLEEDASAGRLKFFKEGRCLLELTHRNGRNWHPITKKVYWPPSFPSSSELKREVPSSIKSQPAVKCKPPRKSKCPSKREESVGHGFVMKPPPQMHALRKKVRSLKRKRRNPYAAIRVGAFLMRVEAALSGPVPPRRKHPPFVLDRIRQSSRLERLISKLPLPRISIKSWAPPTLKTTVKSELFPISETTSSSGSSGICTTMTKAPTKVKASTKNISADTPRPSKTLPVTPTMARIKSEPHSHLHSTGSLLTPDMKRVKVEISGPSSPDRSHFTSPPRKRALIHESITDSASPSQKRHRLSTDSLGSRDDGSNSPYPNHNVPASPPRHHPNGRVMSSFSIDSIISRDEKEAKLVRPMALPASPSRIGDLRREFSMEVDGLSHGSRTPTPASFHGSPAPSRRPLSPPPTSHTSSAPLVSITPYASRNADPSRMDPRLGPQLAHLAGLAADPRLGLTPTGGPYSLVNPYSYLLPLMQGNSAGSAFPPGAGRINWPPSSSSVNASHRSSTSTAVAWPGQYRGEPKIASVEVGRQSPEAPLNLSLK